MYLGSEQRCMSAINGYVSSKDIKTSYSRTAFKKHNRIP